MPLRPGGGAASATSETEKRIHFPTPAFRALSRALRTSAPDPSEVVTLRLSPLELDAVDELVGRLDRASRSDLIREAIREKLRLHEPDVMRHRAMVEVPMGLMRRVNDLMDIGAVSTLQHAVLEGLEMYMDAKERTYIAEHEERRAKLQRIRQEVAVNASAMTARDEP